MERIRFYLGVKILLLQTLYRALARVAPRLIQLATLGTLIEIADHVLRILSSRDWV